VDNLIGTKLSHYRILSQIGAGGMGVVYRAHDETLLRDVAIKVHPPAASADPGRLHRFQQEARAAGALNHPNIVAIYDFGEHEGSPYVVTELLEGRTLREVMAGHPLPVRKALDYGIQIAHGLSAAHEKGIVHRDLKPENLFVTDDGRVKILDFGIAKLMRAEDAQNAGAATQTSAGAILGTTAYMSPEQIRGESVDHRTDIFALGTVLYEMLSGRRPFAGATAADTISAILTQDSPSLTEVPPDLDRAVRRCLEKSPRERFHSAWDLANELERVAEAGPRVRAKADGSGAWKWLVGAAALVFIGLVTLLALRLGLGRLRARYPGGHANMIHSLVVLPFQNLSADPQQQYFVDGMTEELTTALAQIGSLRIISRTSSMQYRDTKKALPEIGRELGVDAVVEGSVLRAGDRVRVTAQLIRTAADEHLWAQSYDRDLNDVLAIQSGVAHLIAEEVTRIASPGQAPKLSKDRPVNPAAHEEYLQGRYLLDAGTGEGLAKALGHFQSAIQKDSTYARAYAAIADYYNSLPFYERVSPRDAFPKAKEAALHAVALDETLGEAHASLAFETAYYEWDWTKAEKEFRRAIELVPSEAGVHTSYSRYLASTGRTDEALADLREAQELSPLSTGLKANEGMVLFFGGRYDEAMTQLRKVVEMNPKHPVAHWGLGLALEQKGLFTDAEREIRKAWNPSEVDPNIMASLGHVYGLQGKRAEARRLLDQLRDESKKTYVSPYHSAVIHAGLGEKDEAFALLNEAADERSTLLVYLRKDPRLKSLRSDSRFQALLDRIGLPG